MELGAAINSMFRWYQNAARCYVYLSDVSKSDNGASGERTWGEAGDKSHQPPVTLINMQGTYYPK